MKFGEAVDSVLVKNYFNFKGKASRSEYWWFLLFMIISGFAASLVEIIAVSASQGSSFNQENFYPYFTMLYMVFLFLPALSVSVRRFHDVGRSTNEAITIYFVQQISGMLVQGLLSLSEPLISMVWFAFIISGFYTLYITLKKSEMVSEN